jgi:hypothetical protein
VKTNSRDGSIRIPTAVQESDYTTKYLDR